MSTQGMMAAGTVVRLSAAAQAKLAAGVARTRSLDELGKILCYDERPRRYKVEWSGNFGVEWLQPRFLESVNQ